MPDESVDELLPKGWSVYVPLLTSLVRDVLTVLGAAGFTWALTVNASQIQMAVSVALILVSAGWSFVQKVRAQRALVVAAKMPPGLPAPKLPA